MRSSAEIDLKNGGMRLDEVKVLRMWFDDRYDQRRRSTGRRWQSTDSAIQRLRRPLVGPTPH